MKTSIVCWSLAASLWSCSPSRSAFLRMPTTRLDVYPNPYASQCPAGTGVYRR